MLLAMENKATVVGTKRASTAPIASASPGKSKGPTPTTMYTAKTVFKRVLGGKG